jgi:5-methylcytosine-specific restriction endonuclease McrA
MRAYLEARDGRACGRCGDPIDRGETASIGHVVAVILGGSDAPDNLRLEHLRCNQSAGADRDRARVVEPADLEAVFHQARTCRADLRPARNGARNGPIKRTAVLFRPVPRR